MRSSCLRVRSLCYHGEHAKPYVTGLPLGPSRHLQQARWRHPRWQPTAISARRAISIDALISVVPQILKPPVILVGLTAALWTIKCINMIIFQNKIIYMPSMPPFARKETVADNQSNCGSVKWQERHIQSLDGTRLALGIGESSLFTKTGPSKPEVVLLYFQGNGSSLPPRMSMLSHALENIVRSLRQDVTLAALSYRGYWTSRGSPSQRGIELDAQAFLIWASETYPDARIILWGQSLGAGVALSGLARSSQSSGHQQVSRVAGIILETPFVSMRRMVVVMYPQKWLPYRYLWPFLRNWWDAEEALGMMERHASSRPPILLITAAKDEVVPASEADYLELVLRKVGAVYKRYDVPSALHNEASTRKSGRDNIAKFVHYCVP